MRGATVLADPTLDSLRIDADLDCDVVDREASGMYRRPESIIRHGVHCGAVEDVLGTFWTFWRVSDVLIGPLVRGVTVLTFEVS